MDGNRRVFMLRVAAVGSTWTALKGFAQGAKLDEKDPQAAALGYVADTTKADAKKYAQHTNDQKCSNCQNFQGKAGDAMGGCAIFGGKQVAAAGWCSAWAKKAA